MKLFLSAISLISCCVILSNCGGGRSGGSDSSPATVRPKTMDGIVLRLNGNVRFEFIRNIGSAAAILNGDVETGAFFYTLGGVQIRQYPNTFSGISDTRYPDTISTASYTYRAINTSSGILTLTGVGSSDLITTGRFNANNGSFVYLFESDSNGLDNNVVVMDITFTDGGGVAASNAATVTIPGGDPRYDSVIIPTDVTLAAGGFVPTNYNPALNPDRVSRIAPATLNNTRYQFRHGGLNPNFNFTIQFAADAGGSMMNNIDEIGQGLLRVNNAPVDSAVDYTYTRIDGTDDARLVLSGSSTTFDGRYTLKYAGTQSGAYIGEADADTIDPADVSGTYRVIAPAAP